jgi:hypothetical protein
VEVRVTAPVTTPQEEISAKIRDLAEQKMPYHSIEQELAKDGVFISYRTIARRLQDELITVG